MLQSSIVLVTAFCQRREKATGGVCKTLFHRAAHPEFIPAVPAVGELVEHTYTYLFESFFSFFLAFVCVPTTTYSCHQAPALILLLGRLAYHGPVVGYWFFKRLIIFPNNRSRYLFSISLQLCFHPLLNPTCCCQCSPCTLPWIQQKWLLWLPLLTLFFIFKISTELLQA